MYTSNKKTGKNIFSLSFDDTILLFKDIYENNYKSIFQNQTLNWFQESHKKYGVVISCYVYYENDDFNLSRFPSKYKKQFEENSDWLRFGFHTLNSKTDYRKGEIKNDYIKTVNQLERIVGDKSIDNVIRLQMFQGSKNNIKELVQYSNQPIKGLLTADDNRQSYYLSKNNNSFIYCHDELYDSSMNLFF